MNDEATSPLVVGPRGNLVSVQFDRLRRFFLEMSSTSATTTPQQHELRQPKSTSSIDVLEAFPSIRRFQAQKAAEASSQKTDLNDNHMRNDYVAPDAAQLPPPVVR
uniref:Uncharacterized protein n=1 Tax=Panagrellus redivivus TaxID=6233 RepID=A0A7E4ZYR2_PANRE